jgi:hypothetical protein
MLIKCSALPNNFLYDNVCMCLHSCSQPLVEVISEAAGLIAVCYTRTLPSWSVTHRFDQFYIALTRPRLFVVVVILVHTS